MYFIWLTPGVGFASTIQSVPRVADGDDSHFSSEKKVVFGIGESCEEDGPDMLVQNSCSWDIAQDGKI